MERMAYRCRKTVKDFWCHSWCHFGLENHERGRGFHCFRRWFAYVQLNDSTYICSKQQPATKNARGEKSNRVRSLPKKV
jgi:hypothetical protein